MSANKFKIFAIASAIALSGCSTHEISSSGIFKFDQVITPSRIAVKDGGNRYWVDLAMFIPVAEKCEGHEKSLCSWLDEKMKDQHLLVSRQYDRYGVSMHSVWVMAGNEVTNEISVNLQAVVEGELSGDQIDYYNLPEHLGRGLIAAKANRASKVNVLEKRGGLKPWMVEKIDRVNWDE